MAVWVVAAELHWPPGKPVAQIPVTVGVSVIVGERVCVTVGLGVGVLVGDNVGVGITQVDPQGEYLNRFVPPFTAIPKRLLHPSSAMPAGEKPAVLRVPK